MIETDAVMKFFDGLASGWDSELRRNEEIIPMILDNAGIQEGVDVLDVACGTGVLIPDYLSRNAASVTGIDIAPKMTEIAREKFAQHQNVTILCGDAADTDFGKKFDCIVIYNAFPHFADQEGMIQHLSTLLKPNGILTVAHARSREMINKHHHNVAENLVDVLMPGEELAEMFGKYLTVTTVVDDDQMYQVAGKFA